jgi:hypothetical protein
MKSRNMPVITIVASLAALGGMALAAQDKYEREAEGREQPAAGLRASSAQGHPNRRSLT